MSLEDPCDEPVPAVAPQAARKVAQQDVGLRAAPPPVTRLNRRTLMWIAGSLAALVMGATLWSLQAPKRRTAGDTQQLYNIEQVSPSEAVAQLPSDYSKLLPDLSSGLPPDVPQLGPPLPGDLGPAIVKSHDPAVASYMPPGYDPALPERDAMRKEAETAAASPVFFRSSTQPAATSADPDPLTPRHPEAFDPLGGGAASSNARGATRGAPGQYDKYNQKRALEPPIPREPAQAFERLMPASPYQLMAGTVIAAALVTGIQSDLPGDVIGTVTEPVYDTATGRHLLIPQGSRILGKYNSATGFGQRRVQVVWNRIILPDTSSLTLDSLVGSDPAGYAGLEDGVDWHWDRVFAGAVLTTLLGVGAELAAPRNRQHGDQVIIVGRDSLQDSVNRVGQEMTRRNLDMQPTLTERPGLPLRIIVNRDLVLQPYQPLIFHLGTR